MLTPILFMLIIGVICGFVLSFASKIFYVYEDPRIAEVESCLAGANCGGCGYAGCSAAAAAVVSGDAMANVCVVGSDEAVYQIADIMGIDAGTAEPILSYNTCTGGNRAENTFNYSGINTCSAVVSLFGGTRSCSIGCLGFGDCVKSCQFNAIVIGADGYPVVNEEKCVGCGACKKACPKDIISLRTVTEQLLDFNKMTDTLAPCRQTCPAEIDIPQYIAHIKNKNYQAAVNTIKLRNPLLLSCGRVCPHPCELDCRRGIIDEAVSINQLKRFVADYEMNLGKRFRIKCAPNTGKSVAVIGGGPAGLSTAYFLRRLGHKVTIYEAMPKLGGIIRYGIPEYRLPKKVLDWEIEGITNLGISVHTNVRLGVDFDLGSLVAAGYDAIFMGIGAWSDLSLGIEGEDLNGCFKAIDFLSRIASGEKIEVAGKKAAVVGGGNSAIDCVRTLIRLGADEVYIVYRRTRKEMPANELEIVAAEHEGVKFKFLAAPFKVHSDENKNLTHLEYTKMELGEPDASGRRRPVPIEGSEEKLELDMLITAISQSPDISFKEDSKSLQRLKYTRWNTIDNNEQTLQTDVPYIFTAGDSATGPALVVDAIGGGRRAARSIHQYVMGHPVKPVDEALSKNKIPGSILDTVEDVKKKPRIKLPELPAESRIKTMDEVDLNISENDAIYESKRCLFCCVHCYNKDS